MYRIEGHEPSSMGSSNLSPQGEERMTVAEYLLQRIRSAGVHSVHVASPLLSSPLAEVACYRLDMSCRPWEMPHEVMWASKIGAQEYGLGVAYLPENAYTTILDGTVAAAQEMLPLLFVVRRSLRSETKELCGLPLSVREQGRSELCQLVKKLAAAHTVLEDRRTAAASIDRAVDTCLELLQPVVIELPDEVAQAYITPHSYKKAFFNYEEKDHILQTWDALVLRLGQSHKPLFVVGQQCWPKMWHSPLIGLSQQFGATILATESLWGHLDSDQVEHVFLEEYVFDEPYDCVCIFGVPADHPWLETVLLHHELDDSGQELFFINSSGVGLGTGEEVSIAPPLQEFFSYIPVAEESTFFTERERPAHELWYTLTSLVCGPSSPLFVANVPHCIETIIGYPPCAKIFLQPEDACEHWLEVAATAWSRESPEEVVAIAGTALLLCHAFRDHAGSGAFLFLVDGSVEEAQEVAYTVSACVLSTPQEAVEWRAIAGQKRAVIRME